MQRFGRTATKSSLMIDPFHLRGMSMGRLNYYFTMLGLLPSSSAAVGYSVLLFVPKKPLLPGCTQCNDAVETPLAIRLFFTSKSAFSGVDFTLILVGFNGRNIAPNMAQFSNIPAIFQPISSNVLFLRHFCILRYSLYKVSQNQSILFNQV